MSIINSGNNTKLSELPLPGVRSPTIKPSKFSFFRDEFQQKQTTQD